MISAAIRPQTEVEFRDYCDRRRIPYVVVIEKLIREFLDKEKEEQESAAATR